MTSCEEGRPGGEELKNCVCLGLGSAGMGDFLERDIGVRRTSGLRVCRLGLGGKKRDTRVRRNWG